MASSNPPQLDQAVRRIQFEVDKRGWSQRMLADKALVGESTIFRLFRGQYTRKTLVKVEQALGLEPSTFTSPTFGRTAAANGMAALQAPRIDFSHTLNEQSDRAPVAQVDKEVADLSFGGYAHRLYEHYIGEYRLIRPGFAVPDRVVSYAFDMKWSNDPAGIAFHDRNPGYEQRGMLMVPSGTPLIHLLTCDAGCSRLITAYHMPVGRRTMSGVLLTIANPEGRQLYPASVPVCLVKLMGPADPMKDALGTLDANHASLFAIRDVIAGWMAGAHMLRADPTTA